MSAWSPYGLEQYRTGGSRKRTRIGLVALVALALLGAFLITNTTEESTIGIGPDGGDSRLSLGERPDDAPPSTRVGIQPGRAVMLQQDVGEAPPPGGQSTGITFEEPYPYLRWVFTYGPFILGPWLIWRWARRPAKQEVNFGVYKGAMPLEMISATNRDVLYSRQAVEAPLFGHSRGDFVPVEADEP